MDNYEKIMQRVITALSDIISVDESTLGEFTMLNQDNGIELIDLAKLVIECEQMFRTVIYDEYVHEFNTIGDLTEYIAKRRDE